MRIKIKSKKKPSRWAAMGALAAYATHGGGPATLLKAQQTGAPGQTEQTLPVFRLAINPGLLGETLAAFQKATGWKVEIPDPGMTTLPSKGVTGVLSAPQALRQILAGTGVNYMVTSPGLAVLQVTEVRSTVQVTDRAPLPSPRYTEPLRDIPQTITVIPKDGEGGTPAGDNLTLRGNSARNDIFVDGVRDLNPQSRDPFNIEQVEVTKGPTSAVSGRGSAGGAINLTSKAPSLRRVIGGSFAFGNAGTWRGTADLNTSLSRLGLGERSAFRLNLLSHHAGVAGRNAVENDRWGFAPSLAFGLGTPTRFTLGYYKLKQDNISDYGIP
jgi:catecholate siderophore receptor